MKTVSSKNGMKVKRIILVSALLTVFAQNALAENCSGPACGGGGHAIGDELYDDVLIENKFDPKTDIRTRAAYNSIVEPRLKELEGLIPEFAADLRRVFEKRWYLVSGKLPNLPEEDINIPKNAQKIASQTGRNVKVNRAWLEKNRKNSQQQIGDLLFHEAIRGLQIELGRDISSEDVIDLYIDLVSGKGKTESDLRNLLKIYHFNRSEHYYTVTEQQQASAFVAEIRKKIHDICADASLGGLELGGDKSIALAKALLTLKKEHVKARPHSYEYSIYFDNYLQDQIPIFGKLYSMDALSLIILNGIDLMHRSIDIYEYFNYKNGIEQPMITLCDEVGVANVPINVNNNNPAINTSKEVKSPAQETPKDANRSRFLDQQSAQ